MRRTKHAGVGQSGAALILTLLIVSILAALALETMRAIQVEEAGARYFQDSIRAEALAKSGVHLAMAMLAEDAQVGQDQQEEVDHPGEQWALLPQEDTLPPAFSELGTLEGEVNDESGKFPINALVDQRKGVVRPAYQRALENLLTNSPFSMEIEEARGLTMAIIDWMDKDEEPSGEFGAEASYYQSLEKPYACRNGPLESLAELQLIRGMDASFYFGKEGGPGLKDLLTVYGDGKINVNTAGPQMLQALVGSDVAADTRLEWAENVVAYREEPLHWEFLKELDWYRNRMPGFNDISLATELITTRSSHFSVQMTGKVGAGRKSVFACLERQVKQEEGESTVKIFVRFWQVY